MSIIVNLLRAFLFFQRCKFSYSFVPVIFHLNLLGPIMRTVNTHQFAFGDDEQNFKIVIPPSLEGHTVSISVDPTKGIGTIVVYRHTPDTSDTPHRKDQDAHRTEESDRDPLHESLENWQPFSSPGHLHSPCAHAHGRPASLAFHNHRTSKRPSAPIYEKPEHVIPTPQRSQGVSFSATPTRSKATRTAQDDKSSPHRNINLAYSLGARLQNDSCHNPEPSHSVCGVDDVQNDDPHHPKNTHIPFHRCYPRENVDGDEHPELFAVPRHLRERFPPLSSVGRNAAWYAIVSGFEIGVFCDNW